MDPEERAQWAYWGPYLAEREWGTVREDYSADGNFWEYFPYYMARSRAYRWGEDGIGGISDVHQRLCVALAFWNEKDPFLKERLFGVTPISGNHGEDVKEYYYYLDAAPSHAYLKMLYKYPQNEFPYEDIKLANRKAGRRKPEIELLDTGVFDQDRYFDIVIEYAKAGPHDILLRVTAHNRGPDPAPLHILPQAWFRNTWSWNDGAARPSLSLQEPRNAVAVEHPDLPAYRLYADDGPRWLFTENDTDMKRAFGFDIPDGYFKAAFHDYIVLGVESAVNPDQTGTKAAAHYHAVVPPASAFQVRFRIADGARKEPFHGFDKTFEQRIAETDAFYGGLQKQFDDDDLRRVHRQALAGMIWNKQFYHYAVWPWKKGDPAQPPPPPGTRTWRNADWEEFSAADVISMPDKWEFPWFAAWDLAFHAVTFGLVDPAFAKHQLNLLTEESFMHPNGQMPAYENGFSDVNPPVHAWATWRVFEMERDQHGGPGDIAFLERMFHKLLLNFGWWVNRKDAFGRNIFQGGFLGLDNIGVFDRGAPLPTGGHLDQADATGWMAMYCLDMMRIALELALHNRAYEASASKFFQHFLHIAKAMNRFAEHGAGLWDEQDGFYYDVLNAGDGTSVPLKVRSVVGILPLLAVEIINDEVVGKLPGFMKRMEWVLDNRPDLAQNIPRWEKPGHGEIRMLTLMSEERIRRVLSRVLDENEFFSSFGIRALSRYHKDRPYTFRFGDNKLSVDYQPGESTSDMFGGNSNWRGPIWFPVNYLIVHALREYHRYFGDAFKMRCPTRTGPERTLNEIADDLSRRLASIFLRDPETGRRPVFGDFEKMQADPHWRDHILFHEYFHGDTGRGCGASHQTGWTGLVANLIQETPHIH